MFRTVSLFCGAAVVALCSTTAVSAQPFGLDADAIAFGTREGVSQMSLSPDGSKAVFTAPGAGRSTIIYVADLTTGTTTAILKSLSNPETLRWCAFVSNRRLACRYTAIVDAGVQLIPAARTSRLIQMARTSSRWASALRPTMSASGSMTARSSTGCPGRATRF